MYRSRAASSFSEPLAVLLLALIFTVDQVDNLNSTITNPEECSAIESSRTSVAQ